MGGKTTGGAKPLAVVFSVTVAVAAWVPSSVTDEGETEQAAVAVVGAIAQLHVTVWLNPACGAADTVALAVWPAVIDCEDGLEETV